MGRFLYSEDSSPQRVYVQVPRARRHYGFFRFVFDVFMTAVTSGFWLIWIFVREMRKR